MYRELNSLENKLSKHALSLKEGILSKKEFREGVLISDTMKSLF